MRRRPWVCLQLLSTTPTANTQYVLSLRADTTETITYRTENTVYTPQWVYTCTLIIYDDLTLTVGCCYIWHSCQGPAPPHPGGRGQWLWYKLHIICYVAQICEEIKPCIYLQKLMIFCCHEQNGRNCRLHCTGRG